MIPLEKIKNEIEDTKTKWLEALVESGGVRKRVTRYLEAEWNKLVHATLGVDHTFSEWRIKRDGKLEKTIGDLAEQASNEICAGLGARFKDLKAEEEVNDAIIKEYSASFKRRAVKLAQETAEADACTYIDDNIHNLVSESAADTHRAIYVLRQSIDNLPYTSHSSKRLLEEQIKKLQGRV